MTHARSLEDASDRDARKALWAEPATNGRPSIREVHRIDRRLLLAVLGALIIVVVANNSSGSLAQPAIARAFSAGPADVGWVVFGYSATFAIGTAVWGGIASRFGLGPSLAVGVLLFSAGSAIAVFAPSLPVLVAARLLQGVGSGAIPTLAAALIAARFAGADRSRALGVNVAAVGAGLALGPLLGGIGLELIGWQAAVAFGVVAAPAAWLLFREGPPRATTTARLDIVGAALTSVVVLAAVFLLNRFAALGVGPLTVAASIVLAIGTAALAHRSIRHRDAFLPRRVLADAVFHRTVVLGAIGMSAFLGTLVLLPVAISRAHALDGIALGLVLLPLAVTGAACSLQNARVQAAIGRAATTTVALAALALGTLVLAALGAEAVPTTLAVALMPIGVGFGLLGPPLLNELTTSFSDADRSVAVGVYNLGFFLGGAVGAAISTALLQSAVELPLFAGRVVPGYATAELLLALPPSVAVTALIARGMRRTSRARATAP